MDLLGPGVGRAAARRWNHQLSSQTSDGRREVAIAEGLSVKELARKLQTTPGKAGSPPPE